MTERPLTAVLLAGTLRPSPLRRVMDVPLLCLPMGREGTVLDAWMRSLSTIPGLRESRIVLNTEREVETVAGSAPSIAEGGQGSLGIRAIAEPASWRGPAGLVRDVAGDLAAEAIVLVCEANLLPPPTLAPMLEAVRNSVSGVVGVCGVDEPSGVYAFARSALDTVPTIGYYDLKEQLLPTLAHDGVAIGTARLGDRAMRLRDRRGYLAAVRTSLAAEGEANVMRISPRAAISGSAILDGFCIVEDGAVIEDGAVVHDTVVLSGATVGGGAVVSRSLVGSLASVPPRSKVIRDVVSDSSVIVPGRTASRRRRAADRV
jgi:mannose-1-phosphate guanylyltransferase